MKRAWRIAIPVLLLLRALPAFASPPGPGETSEASRAGFPEWRTDRILVLGAPAPPTPPSFTRISAFLDYRHAFAPGVSFPGGGAGVELSFPAGPFRLGVFAAGGAIAREESRVEDRPFTQMVGGEPVTFIRRVEVTEREAAPLFSAGLCLGWAADLGRGWVLEGNLGPAAGRPRDAWGAGGRASLSLAIDAGGFVLLARIAAELFKARDWEGGLAAGVGAALRF